MSIPHINAVFAATDLEPYARLLMLAIADRADDVTGEAYPSIADLMQRTGMVERSIQNVTKRLIESGWLTVKFGGGRHQRNRYKVNINPAPNAGNDEKPRTEYTAPVARYQGETPHLVPETPHLTTVNPAPGAGEPPENQREPKEERIEPAAPQFSPAPEKPRPKARLPGDWALSDEGWEYARSKQLRDDEIKEMADEFHVYWADRTDAGGKKSGDGWRATWQGHVRRNAAQYIRNRNMAGKTTPGGYGQGGSIASIVARRHAAG